MQRCHTAEDFSHNPLVILRREPTGLRGMGSRVHRVLESVTLILSAQKPEGGVGRVEVGEAVFWVFWCWFVGCLVVEGVVLALGVWIFGMEAMADSGIASANN